MDMFYFFLCKISRAQKDIQMIVEGMHGTRPKVTFDVMSNSPFVYQANTCTRQYGGIGESNNLSQVT